VVGEVLELGPGVSLQGLQNRLDEWMRFRPSRALMGLPCPSKYARVP